MCQIQIRKAQRPESARSHECRSPSSHDRAARYYDCVWCERRIQVVPTSSFDFDYQLTRGQFCPTQIVHVIREKGEVWLCAYSNTVKMAHVDSRTNSKLITTIASTFTSYYIYLWPQFFPDNPLSPPLPSFDGRAVCYPSVQNLRDYMSWRQVDCASSLRAASGAYMLMNPRSYQQPL